MLNISADEELCIFPFCIFPAKLAASGNSFQQQLGL